jgi:predicted transporter
MHKILPQTKSRPLQMVVIICSLLVAYLGIQTIMAGGIFRYLFASLLIFPTAVGLWLLKEPARMLFSAVALLAIIFIPAGIFNPFYAMDHQGNPPPVTDLALAIYPCVAIGLFLVHILGKHKNEFTPLFKKST